MGAQHSFFCHAQSTYRMKNEEERNCRLHMMISIVISLPFASYPILNSWMCSGFLFSHDKKIALKLPKGLFNHVSPLKGFTFCCLHIVCDDKGRGFLPLHCVFM